MYDPHFLCHIHTRSRTYTYAFGNCVTHTVLKALDPVEKNTNGRTKTTDVRLGAIRGAKNQC